MFLFINTFLIILFLIVINEKIKAQLEWLRTHKEPFEDIKTRWDATHDVRIEILRNSTQTIYDYIKEFSFLQLSSGCMLVITIFKKIYIFY